MNYFDERRVRSIPNIIRRNGGKFGEIDAKSGNVTNGIQNSWRNRYNIGSDVAIVEANSSKSVTKQKAVGQNCRRRKQELGLKELWEEDLEWRDCGSKTSGKVEKDVQDLDRATNSFQESTVDQQVPLTSQVPTQHVLLDFCFDKETEWLEVQSSIEVESYEPTEFISDIPPIDEIKEASFAAKDTSRSKNKKFKSLSDFSEKENRDTRIGDEFKVAGKSYSCWVCDKRYVYKSSLRYHKKKVHGLDNGTNEKTDTSTKVPDQASFTRLARTRKIKKRFVKKIDKIQDGRSNDTYP